MTILRFALQAVLAALVGMALLKIILSFRVPQGGTGASRAADVATSHAPTGAVPVKRSVGFSKGLLSLPVDALAPAPSGQWVLGGAHALLHVAFSPNDPQKPWAQCLWTEGTLEALNADVVRLRVEAKPRPSRLEAYARQKGLHLKVVLQLNSELTARAKEEDAFTPCRHWRHIPPHPRARGAAGAGAASMLALRVGTSKVLTGDDLASLVRIRGHAAVVARDVFTRRWRVEGVEPGVARFRLERLPGPREEILEVRVEPRRTRASPRAPKPRGTPRAGVFLVPGWPRNEPSGKTAP